MFVRCAYFEGHIDAVNRVAFERCVTDEVAPPAVKARLGSPLDPAIEKLSLPALPVALRVSLPAPPSTVSLPSPSA